MKRRALPYHRARATQPIARLVHCKPSSMGSHIYLVKPTGKVACLRQAGTLARAAKGAAREFPAGVETVRMVRVEELADMAAAGMALPVAARRIVEAHRKLPAASEQRQAQRERLRRRVQAAKAQPLGQEARAPYPSDLFHAKA